MCWDTVCKVCDEGGLGVKNVEEMDVALLSKWKWRILANEKAVWRGILLSLAMTAFLLRMLVFSLKSVGFGVLLRLFMAAAMRLLSCGIILLTIFGIWFLGRMSRMFLCGVSIWTELSPLILATICSKQSYPDHLSILLFLKLLYIFGR